jgi:glycerol kinase
VTERERIVGERRTGQRRTEVVWDEETGKNVVRTFEAVEKTIEHEVKDRLQTQGTLQHNIRGTFLSMSTIRTNVSLFCLVWEGGQTGSRCQMSRRRFVARVFQL